MQNNKRIKNKFYIENLICLFIILNPILDIISFLVRNKFYDNPGTTNSITALLRPIIPVILSIFIFIKSSGEQKRRLLLLVFIYVLYAVEHMLLCMDNFREWSYGTPKQEFSFVLNYTFFIVTLIVIKNIIGKDSKLKINRPKTNITYGKVYNSIIIALAIYIVSIFISIFTKTSSYTYPEVNIGYKGWIESGNCLSIFLILAFGILLSQINIPKDKKEILPLVGYVLLAIVTSIYMVFLMGTRVGLYGTFIVLIVWTLLKLIIDKKFILFISGLLVIILLGLGVFKFGSATLNRRTQLDQANQNIIEAHAVEIDEQEPKKEEKKEPKKVAEDNIDIKESKNEEGKNHVTKDIGEVHEKIQNGTISNNYMTIPQKESIEKLYEEAKQKQVDSNDNRSQQLIYHVNLVKQERDIYKIFFGNGFQTPPGELILEKEFFALLFNFGICGFILYFGPIIAILLWSIIKVIVFIIKNRKTNLFKVIRNISTKTFMQMFLMVLVVALSIVIGYILFNVSNSTLIATIIILLYNRIKEEI